MTKLIDTINNIIKLVSSLATIAILGGLVYGVLWVRAEIARLTKDPIQLPTVKMPPIEMPKIDVGKMLPEKITMPKIEAPEIKIKAPTVDFSGLFGRKEPESESFRVQTYKCWHKPYCGDFITHRKIDYFRDCAHYPKCVTAEEHIRKCDLEGIAFNGDKIRACGHTPTCGDAEMHLRVCESYLRLHRLEPTDTPAPGNSFSGFRLDMGEE